MSRPRRNIVVVGGGVGALEAALALRADAFDCVDVQMLAPESCFTYRPLSVGEPFGHEPSWSFELGSIAADRGFGLRAGSLASVEADAHRIVTDAGERIDYDALVLSLGAVPRPAVAGALTFTGREAGTQIADAIRAGAEVGRPLVAFAAPAHTAWTLPLYELALLTAAWARDEEIAVDLLVVTSEAAPLEVLGPTASDEISELLAEQGVAVVARTTAHEYRQGRLWLAPVGSLSASLTVALPRLDGPAVAGLPCDELGFVPVDEYCRVQGVDDVYAIGDMADHPIKQGGLAAQQADVAAAAIAAWAGAPVDPQPYEPVLRALMFTGGRNRFFRYPRGGDGPMSAADPGSSALWWPAHKIAARHLAAYVAANRHLNVAG